MAKRKTRQGWKLSISISGDHREVRIDGDKAGLEFLAKCCLSVIGRKDASNHILIDPLMYNASNGSVPLTLSFDERRNAELERAATGRPHEEGQ